MLDAQKVVIRKECDDFEQVDVKILDMDWCFRHNNITKLIRILAETDNDCIFSAL